MNHIKESKVKLKYFCVLFLFFISTLVAQPTTVSVTDPTKPIILISGVKQFSININSNPTTGYTWRLSQYDPNILAPVSQGYRRTQLAIGGGGVQNFVFIVKDHAIRKPTQISFIYVRPWNMSIAKSLTYNIVFQ